MLTVTDFQSSIGIRFLLYNFNEKILPILLLYFNVPKNGSVNDDRKDKVAGTPATAWMPTKEETPTT